MGGCGDIGLEGRQGEGVECRMCKRVTRKAPGRGVVEEIDGVWEYGVSVYMYTNGRFMH